MKDVTKLAFLVEQDQHYVEVVSLWWRLDLDKDAGHPRGSVLAITNSSLRYSSVKVLASADQAGFLLAKDLCTRITALQLLHVTTS